MQNSSVNQTKMLLTRAGRGSRVVLTGDLGQCDLEADTNGLRDLIDRLEARPEQDFASLIQFEEQDVQRSELVKRVLAIYE